MDPERILLSIVLIMLGLLAFHASNRWALRRAQGRYQADPLLARFQPGRPAILYFTSEHCAACRFSQHPVLISLSEELGPNRIQIIEVDADQQHEAAQRWGVMSLPTTFVLDTKGTPQAVNYGVASAPTLLRQLRDLVSPRSHSSKTE
ncbi:MAG: thioredoxin family protein [Chloroflexi bacterium]|nr:thioredoxin family protein [Chloroflexota bacterium]